MEKSTVLAHLRFTIDFTPEMQRWFQNFPDAKFAQEKGDVFLHEFGGEWNDPIQDITNSEIQGYFHSLGLTQQELPYIGEPDIYNGSLILDTAILMTGTAASSYVILSRIARDSDLSSIANGLQRIKDSIIDKVNEKLKPDIIKTLASNVNQYLRQNNQPQSVFAPPAEPISITLVMDTRPLLAIGPALVRSHSICLSCGISKDALQLENLGDEELKDVRVGLFRSDTKLKELNLDNAFQGMFPLISPKQGVSKAFRDFVSRQGGRFAFDIDDKQDIYVDCWVQDSYGIYVVNFFLGNDSPRSLPVTSQPVSREKSPQASSSSNTWSRCLLWVIGILIFLFVVLWVTIDFWR